MKIPGTTWVSLAAAAVVMSWVCPSVAQTSRGEDFPGVKQVLTPEQYSAAGIGKLSPAEQAKLDEFLKGYFTGATQRVAEQAASQAVDRAVKEKKVSTPTVIESRLIGSVSGWGDRTVFMLENGQRWKPVDNSKTSFAPIQNPEVLIVRDTFGYKMAIAGATIVRVHRL